MNINHLIEYIYLAETLSFKRTADYFYVSRSVISRHLASLEETLGVKLVDRGNQSVQLTESGRVFYQEAQNVLRAYANAVDRTRAAGKSDARPVRVGYLKNAARPVIVSFVRFLGHEHPDVHLDLRCLEYGELRRALEEGSVDVALAVDVKPEVSRHYRSTPVYTDRFYAVMSKDHPLAKRSQVRFQDLPRERLLLPDSFLFAGASDLGDALSGDGSQAAAREYYADVDMLFLKVQVEGYVAFSSGLNNALFGDQVAVLPVTGIDSSFSVSAFYADGFDGPAYDACRKAFESCHASMKGGSPGISLASFI